MRKFLLIFVLSSFSLIGFADDHEWTTYTGEVLQCNLKDGKSVEDVMDMVRTDWYELDYPIPYDGWVTTPTLFADNDGGYDLFWAGFTVVGIADSFASDEIRSRIDLAQPIIVFTQDVVRRDGKIIPLYERIKEADGPTAVVLPESRDPSRNSLRNGDIHWHEFIVRP